MTEQARYAVVGNPIEHSLSPRIHAAFAEQTGEALVYERLLAPLEGFRDAVERFFAEGGAGLNVTVPFKQQAWEMAGRHEPRAARAGAVNTLWRAADSTLIGDNTDGAGLARDLRVNNGVTLTGARVLVLGAGGAVRGILDPLLAEGPREVVIANRTPARAEELRELFADSGTLVACTFEDLAGPFDVIINGTSASLRGDLPPLPGGLITPETVCYDMMYSQAETAFNAWARQQGAGLRLDGLGMLVEQAAESFLQWRGVRPDTGPVMAMLRPA
ncbi:shikimate dehydrogenase [Vreelandella utahensis]|uniref:shikimate dehydrogenase n=1 Tax=Vreelandella halophila TaxID=86177 RepID=UPI000987A182|nr:shikimate dehydrogenase [Halomonas utahensis]